MKRQPLIKLRYCPRCGALVDFQKECIHCEITKEARIPIYASCGNCALNPSWRCGARPRSSKGICLKWEPASLRQTLEASPMGLLQDHFNFNPSSETTIFYNSEDRQTVNEMIKAVSPGGVVLIEPGLMEKDIPTMWEDGTTYVVNDATWPICRPLIYQHSRVWHKLNVSLVFLAWFSPCGKADCKCHWMENYNYYNAMGHVLHNTSVVVLPSYRRK